MYTVPASILNDIARTQTLRTNWARRLFALDQQGLIAALKMQGDEMEAQGVPDRLALAYQVTALLLAENEAISKYIVATDRLDLRSALPEIVSVREAVLVAEGDYRLSDDEKEQLAGMLTPLDPWAAVEDEPAVEHAPRPRLWPEPPAPNPLTKFADKLDASPEARRLLMEAIEAAVAAEKARGE